MARSFTEWLTMSKRYKAHIVFVFLMIVYFLIRYLRSTFPELPNFIRFHLTDLLFVPTMSVFALIVIRLFRRDPSVKIHWFSVLIQVVIVSIYFEWYLPKNTPEGHLHVSDWIDCTMYVIGGVLFILLQPSITTGQKKTEPANGFRNVKDKNV